MKRIWVIAGIVLGVLIILGIGYLGFSSNRPEVSQQPLAPETVPVTVCDVLQTVTAPGTVVNTEEIVLRLPLTGRVEEILVKPGDAVSIGDALARFSAGDVMLALAQAEMDVVTAQGDLETAQNARDAVGYPRTDSLSIERAQMYFDAADARYRSEQANYDEVAYLSSTDPVRLFAMENLLQAKRERDQLAANLNWLSGHADNLDLAEAQARVAIAEAKLTQAQEALARLDALFKIGEEVGDTLNSPVEGVVMEVKAGNGETVPAGGELVILVNPQALEARVTILEEDYPYVAVGQQAELYFDALPDEEVTGTVSRVVPLRTSGDRPTYYVYITLDHIPEHLVDGMTVDSAIIIAQRQQVLCLPRALVRASSSGPATVSVWNGLASETRQIELGLRGDVYIEILSGLEEGELVVSK